MARGRPRKSGKRHPNGKLKQEPYFDRGSEWVQSRVAKYDTHYTTALGRAYAAKLLGDEAESQDRYEGGKRFARVYNRVFGGETYRCALDPTPHGAAGNCEASEYIAKERAWILDVIRDLDAAGLRPWLDQLISRLYTYHGPPWLDRLIADQNNQADLLLIQAARDALDVVAPHRKHPGF